jgi:predicted  nucleic acid-binding Zn-ribbon protein
MTPKVTESLYRLQLLDTELSEQLSVLREAESLLGESAELLSARGAREQAGAELATWIARLRELEMDLEVLNSRIAATEQRLYSGRVSNPKELAGIQQDHDHSKRSREKVEDEVLLAMERVEKCEKAVADASARLKEAETRWHEEQGRLASRIEGLQAKVAQLKRDREDVAALLAPSALVLYENLLRKKGGRAVVLLVGQMCQGCRVTVPSSKAQLVRRSQDLITCTNCGRILTTEL